MCYDLAKQIINFRKHDKTLGSLKYSNFNFQKEYLKKKKNINEYKENRFVYLEKEIYDLINFFEDNEIKNYLKICRIDDLILIKEFSFYLIKGANERNVSSELFKLYSLIDSVNDILNKIIDCFKKFLKPENNINIDFEKQREIEREKKKERLIEIEIKRLIEIERGKNKNQNESKLQFKAYINLILNDPNSIEKKFGIIVPAILFNYILKKYNLKMNKIFNYTFYLKDLENLISVISINGIPNIIRIRINKKDSRFTLYKFNDINLFPSDINIDKDEYLKTLINNYIEEYKSIGFDYYK